MARITKAKATEAKAADTTDTTTEAARVTFDAEGLMASPAYAAMALGIPAAAEGTPGVMVYVIRESGRSFYAFTGNVDFAEDGTASVSADFMVGGMGTVESAAKAVLTEAGVNPADYLIKGQGEVFKEANPMPAKETEGKNEPELDFAKVEGIDDLKIRLHEAASKMDENDKQSRAVWSGFGAAIVAADAAFAAAFPDQTANNYAFGRWVRTAFDGMPNILSRMEDGNFMTKARFMGHAPAHVVDAMNANTGPTFEKNALEALRKFASNEKMIAKIVTATEAEGAAFSIADLSAALGGDKERAKPEALAFLWPLVMERKAEHLAELEAARDKAEADYSKAADTVDGAPKSLLVARNDARKAVADFCVIDWLVVADAPEDHLSGRAPRAVKKAIAYHVAAVNAKANKEAADKEAGEAAEAERARAYAELTPAEAAAQLFAVLRSHGEAEAVYNALGELAADLFAEQAEAAAAGADDTADTAAAAE